MVEKSHTAGWWPNLYEPLRGVGQKIADWFAPRSEASAGQSSYDITMELPGVRSENIDVSVHDGSLTIKGEKRSQREENGRTYKAYDIYNKEGYYEAKVWSDIAPTLFVKGKMYRVDEDEETGYSYLKRFRVVWN